MKVQWSGRGLEFVPETDFEEAILVHLQSVLMHNVKIEMGPGGPRPDEPNPALVGADFDVSTGP